MAGTTVSVVVHRSRRIGLISAYTIAGNFEVYTDECSIRVVNCLSEYFDF